MTKSHRLAVFILGTMTMVQLTTSAQALDERAYRNANLAVEARVDDLLSRMTLEEKVAQLTSVWQMNVPISDAQGVFAPEKAKEVLKYGIGEISRPSEIGPGSGLPAPLTRDLPASVAFVNALQRFLVENTRLGIPAMCHEEALHGLAVSGATNFPTPLGLASSWDPALVERGMTVAAREARARGITHVLSPVLDLARDPRWGRTEETYGEDPYLVGRMGVAAIRGYQGEGLPLGAERGYATAKHFAGHGPHEGGINTAPTSFGERLLREQYLRPFETAIAEARPAAIMPSYNELDGIPSHKSRWLLQRVLRGEWGFDGLVVSDYFGISEMKDRHSVAATLADAAAQAIEAGVDLELPFGAAYATLVEQVRAGRIPQAAVDRAVARVLRFKFLAGLFENPYADLGRAQAATNAAEHRTVALEAAHKTIVLLKNEKGLLPLDRTRLRSIAVIGPNAKGVHLGGYSAPRDAHGIDILSGVTEKLGSAVKVLYAEGCRITEEWPDWWRDKVTPGDPVKNRQRIAEAVAVAKQADVALVVVGSNEETSREAWSDEHLGDASDLALTGQQDELVRAVVATGKPTIVLLLNGRPYAITEIAQTVPAIIEGWYLGEEGGRAVADVLFGDVNPSGKLPISIPRTVGQLPVYYSRKPSSFRSYLFGEREPLYAFGHGLSYTTFKIDNLRVEPAVIDPKSKTMVMVDVTNTGKRAGEEVVQLYVHDRVASSTRPVKELRGFTRVGLAPGEKRSVSIPLEAASLWLLDDNMTRVVEPGAFDVMVGDNSVELVKGTLEVAPR